MIRKFAIIRYPNKWEYEIIEWCCSNWWERDIKSFIKPLCYMKFMIWFFICCRDDEYTFIEFNERR